MPEMNLIINNTMLICHNDNDAFHKCNVVLDESACTDQIEEKKRNFIVLKQNECTKTVLCNRSIPRILLSKWMHLSEVVGILLL